jgi:DNA repair photolyase
MTARPHAQRGRGTSTNPPNRFESRIYTPFEEDIEELEPLPRTQFLKDASRSVLSWNDSPDLPYDAGLNPYRGCEHGCAYCYARPYHEFLGYSSGLDFETKILVKEDAPELLRREFESSKWVPQVIGMSGVTDPYQPIERKLLLTRRCLEVLAEFRNPVTIVTKNHLVTRDIDILTRLARYKAVMVNLSVTTLDPDLGRSLEPRTSSPAKRLEAIHQLAQAGIPVGVMVAPVIPGLTDHEIPQIVKATAEAGARSAWHCVVRLPRTVRDLFTTWLETCTPLRKEKVLNRLKEIRGDSLDDSRFHIRMEGEGEWAEQIRQVFDLACKKANLSARRCGLELSVSAFRRPGPSQEKLF